MFNIISTAKLGRKHLWLVALSAQMNLVKSSIQYPDCILLRIIIEKADEVVSLTSIAYRVNIVNFVLAEYTRTVDKLKEEAINSLPELKL